MPRARQRNDSNANAVIGVRVTEATKAELDKLAEAKGISLSHFCAQVLSDRIESAA